MGCPRSTPKRERGLPLDPDPLDRGALPAPPGGDPVHHPIPDGRTLRVGHGAVGGSIPTNSTSRASGPVTTMAKPCDPMSRNARCGATAGLPGASGLTSSTIRDRSTPEKRRQSAGSLVAIRPRSTTSPSRSIATQRAVPVAQVESGCQLRDPAVIFGHGSASLLWASSSVTLWRTLPKVTLRRGLALSHTIYPFEIPILRCRRSTWIDEPQGRCLAGPLRENASWCGVDLRSSSDILPFARRME